MWKRIAPLLPVLVSLSCLVFEEWKPEICSIHLVRECFVPFEQEMCSLEGIPVGWIGCSWHDWINKGPSIVLNCTAALLLPSSFPCNIPFFCYLFQSISIYCQVKCFSGCELKPAWTSGLRQIFQISLGNWCCFPGELSREQTCLCSSFSVFSHQTKTSPAVGCEEGGWLLGSVLGVSRDAFSLSSATDLLLSWES